MTGRPDWQALMSNIKRFGQLPSYSADMSPDVESYMSLLPVGCWPLSAAWTEPLLMGVQGRDVLAIADGPLESILYRKLLIPLRATIRYRSLYSTD